MKLRLPSLLAALLVFAGLGLSAQTATAMTVQPVVIDLQTSGRGMTQVITVTNSFAQPLAVELRTEDLIIDENGAHGSGKETGDLLVFPPQAMIQPGQTQSFRVQYVGEPDMARSKHYYVTVAQLPVKLPEGASSIQVLYNFQVLVSVSPAGGKPELSIAQASIGRDESGRNVPILMVANKSNTHGFLSKGRLRIVQKDSAGKEIFRQALTGPELEQSIGFGLIGAGQQRRVQLPIALPSAEGSLQVEFTPEG